MSFTQTPLNNSRRVVDHQEFMRGTARAGNHQPQRNSQQETSRDDSPNTPPASPRRRPGPSTSIIAEPSFGYGAPSKPSSSLNQRHPSLAPSGAGQEEDEDISPVQETAQQRYARVAERNNQAQAQAHGKHPRVITSPVRNDGPNPFPQGTSVGIASAINQAHHEATLLKTQDAMPKNQSSSSSTTATTALGVNSGWSSTTLGASASSSSIRATNSRGSQVRPKPPSKQMVQEPAVQEDDDDIEERYKRGKSPVIQAAHSLVSKFRALAPDSSVEDSGQYQSMAISPDISEDTTNLPSRTYEEEDNIYAQLNEQSRNNKPAKKARTSHDNKAYNPNKDAPVSSSDEESDGGSRRKKKKGIPGRSRLDGGLPVVTAEKQKKKKASRARKTVSSAASRQAMEESEEEESLATTSVRHKSPMPPRQEFDEGDESTVDRAGVEHGLEEPMFDHDPSPTAEELAHQASLRKSPPATIGRKVGTFVYYLYRFVVALIVLVGRAIAAAFDTVFARPSAWVRAIYQSVSHWDGAALTKVGGFLALALLIASLWSSTGSTNTRGGFLSSILGSDTSPGPTYNAPITPPGTIDELVSRLAALETAYTDLSGAHRQTLQQIRNEAKSYSAQIGSLEQDTVNAQSDARSSRERLVVLEGKLEKEMLRAKDAEARLQDAAKKALEMGEAVAATGGQQPTYITRAELDGLASDLTKSGKQDAATRLAHLRSEILAEVNKLDGRLGHAESRVGQAETSVHHALDVGKKLQAMVSKVSGDVTLRSKDGKDVTPALGDLVQKAIATYSKDGIGRSDFAIYSAGGRIIPSLTSDTYALRPKSWFGSLWGGEYPEGRSPLIALIPDNNVGNCWPFAGHQATLGVYLARTVYITDVTIDHAPADLVFDTSPAPKEFAVWGIVDGQENKDKLIAYKAGLLERKEAGTLDAAGLDELEATSPISSKSYDTLRLATFSYDVTKSNNIQTFPIPEHIRALGIDFGLVMFEIKSNWGHVDFTCLYRVRVHGVARSDQKQVPEVVGEDGK